MALSIILPSLSSCGENEKALGEQTQQPVVITLTEEPEVDYHLARVIQDGSGKERKAQLPLCYDPTASSCKTGSYLVPNDEILASKREGGFLRIDYVNSVGESSQGWVMANRVELLAQDSGERAGWAGRWQADSKDVLIRRESGSGFLIARGYGTYGTDDPERLRRGTMSMGEFEAKFEVRNDRVAFAVGYGDEDEQGHTFVGREGDPQKTLPYDTEVSGLCRLKLRRIGHYLIVDDNSACGGANFTFRAIYRRMKDERHVTNRFNRITFGDPSEPTW